jgi:CheY-like chemotaxis protein
LETTRRIRALGKQLPIIALSANAVSGARALFLEAGMNDFISKPIEPKALNAALLKWLPKEKVTFSQETAKPMLAPKPDVILDSKAGLHYAMDDETIYHQLLSDFQSIHIHDDEKISACLRTQDIDTAHRIAHTLKSASALIGAQKLRKAAAELETAFDKEHAIPSPFLLDAVHLALSELSSELSSWDLGEDWIRSEENLELDLSLATPLIEKLTPLLESGNALCLELIPEIREVFASLGPHVETLITQMQRFDFFDASLTLKSLGQQI